MDPLVSVEWLKSTMDDPNLIILDCSIPKVGSQGQSKYQGKRIPGARFFDIKGNFSDKECDIPNMLISPEIFEKQARNLGINENSIIITYDNLGVYSSPRVWWMFKVMGHNQVAVLDGGLPEWVKNENKIEEIKIDSYSPGNFKSNFQVELVKNKSDISENLSTGKALVLDARSKGRFEGKAPEPRAHLIKGHIPKSINLFYQEVLKDGKFLPKDELSQAIGALNLGTKPLIFSCGSGITACIIMLACEIVTNNEKAVYDGSWSEWGIPENNLPISF